MFEIGKRVRLNDKGVAYYRNSLWTRFDVEVHREGVVEEVDMEEDGVSYLVCFTEWKYPRFSDRYGTPQEGWRVPADELEPIEEE